MITRSMRTPARYWKQVRITTEDEMRWKAPLGNGRGPFYIKKEVLKREICVEL